MYQQQCRLHIFTSHDYCLDCRFFFIRKWFLNFWLFSDDTHVTKWNSLEKPSENSIHLNSLEKPSEISIHLKSPEKCQKFQFIRYSGFIHTMAFVIFMKSGNGSQLRMRTQIWKWFLRIWPIWSLIEIIILENGL